MIIRLLHLIERLTGALLGSLCVGVQLGNVLVCIFVLLLGPAVVIELLPQ